MRVVGDIDGDDLIQLQGEEGIWVCVVGREREWLQCGWSSQTHFMYFHVVVWCCQLIDWLFVVAVVCSDGEQGRCSCVVHYNLWLVGCWVGGWLVGWLIGFVVLILFIFGNANSCFILHKQFVGHVKNKNTEFTLNVRKILKWFH